MNRALIKFLYSTYPDFNSTDLSYFAKELFKEDISKDREKLFNFGKVDINPYIEDFKNEQNGTGVKGSKSTTEGSTPVSQNSVEEKTKKKQSFLILDLKVKIKTRKVHLSSGLKFLLHTKGKTNSKITHSGITKSVREQTRSKTGLMNLKNTGTINKTEISELKSSNNTFEDRINSGITYCFISWL